MRMRRALAWGLVAAVLSSAPVACGDDDDADDGRLPAVEGSTAPEAYRIVYQVLTPDSTTEEERIVHRPFDAHVIVRDGDGNVTAERWSALGALVTRSQGGEAVAIDTAIAPAASDLRPDRFGARLEAAGRLEAGESVSVSGRACTRAKEVGAVAVAPDATSGSTPTTLSVLVERCVDALGLVLEERWTTVGGERVLTKRAVDLDLGDDVPAIEVPDVAPLPPEQGNGAVREVEADATPPFQEAWALPAPAGFTFVGRFAVQPARLGSAGAAAGEADLALYTDVWVRDGDLLLLDQGASRSGNPPFDPDTVLGPVELPGLGSAELALDLRLAEVRLRRPEGGFVRVAGTVDPDELVELARTLQRQGGAAP
jgi:hypothetical protein